MANISSNSKVAYIYDSATDTWYPTAGLASTSANYSWTGTHNFASPVTFDEVVKAKAGINNFQNPAERDTAMTTTPANGVVVFVRQDNLGNIINQIQYAKNGQWINYKAVTVEEKTSSYIVDLHDVDKLIKVNSSSNLEVTIPNDATTNFPVGSRIEIGRYGTGNVTITSPVGSGVTIRSVQNIYAIPYQYGSAVITKIAANEWWVFFSSFLALPVTTAAPTTTAGPTTTTGPTTTAGPTTTSVPTTTGTTTEQPATTPGTTSALPSVSIVSVTPRSGSNTELDVTFNASSYNSYQVFANVNGNINDPNSKVFGPYNSTGGTVAFTANGLLCETAYTVTVQVWSGTNGTGNASSATSSSVSTSSCSTTPQPTTPTTTVAPGYAYATFCQAGVAYAVGENLNFTTCGELQAFIEANYFDPNNPITNYSCQIGSYPALPNCTPSTTATPTPTTTGVTTPTAAPTTTTAPNSNGIDITSSSSTSTSITVSGTYSLLSGTQGNEQAEIIVTVNGSATFGYSGPFNSGTSGSWTATVSPLSPSTNYTVTATLAGAATPTIYGTDSTTQSTASGTTAAPTTAAPTAAPTTAAPTAAPTTAAPTAAPTTAGPTAAPTTAAPTAAPTTTAAPVGLNRCTSFDVSMGCASTSCCVDNGCGSGESCSTVNCSSFGWCT